MLNGQPYKYPFKGQGFLMTCGKSCVPPSERKRERESHRLLISKAHTLECQDCGSSHWVEDLWCTRPLVYTLVYKTSLDIGLQFTRCAQATCMRTAWTHISYMYENRMGCTRGQQLKEIDFSVFLGMFFNGWILILKHPDHRYEFQISKSLFYNGF